MPKRLLVVDDEPNLLRALSMCLRVAGYEVRTASNGAEALVRLAESPPDLLISDVRMPHLDGYGLAQQVRASPRTRLVPIVFLTAKDRIEDRVEAFRSGIDYYLTKPFETEELLAVVGGILNRVERTHSEIASLVGATKVEDAAGQPLGEDFTPSEERVARAVARGMRNKEIAEEFGVSARTIETHVRRIMAKKNFNSRVEIARYVLERETP